MNDMIYDKCIRLGYWREFSGIVHFMDGVVSVIWIGVVVADTRS